MFELNLFPTFLKKSKKFVLKDKLIRPAIKKTTNLLKKDPKTPSLKSHKVIRKNGEITFSSLVTNYLRIIWDYPKY